MRTVRVKILMILLLQVIMCYAQDECKLMFGAEIRSDANCSVEYNMKYLNGHKSFALKGAYYNYTANFGDIGVVNGYGSSWASFKENVEGFCIKPSWIFYHKLRKHLYYSHTLAAVVSRNEHQFEINFPDNSISGHKVNYRLGAEYEFLIGVRFLDNFIISTAFQCGYKQPKRYFFNDIVEGYPSYRNYTPAQGYFNSRVYLNATLGLSYIF